MGVMISENQFAMISDWMVNGNIGVFVKAQPDINRISLVSFIFGLTALYSLTISDPSSWKVSSMG